MKQNLFKNLIADKARESKASKYMPSSDFFDALGISKATYYKYLRDSSDIKLGTLIKLADFFNMKLKDLILFNY